MNFILRSQKSSGEVEDYCKAVLVAHSGDNVEFVTCRFCPVEIGRVYYVELEGLGLKRVLFDKSPDEQPPYTYLAKIED